MKINYEVYKIMPRGVRVLVEKSRDLKDATIAAFRLSVGEPGNCTLFSAQNTSEPILEWKYF